VQLDKQRIIGNKIKRNIVKKSGQATYIAPLQPPILALFPAWGSSEGAGRIRLAHRKNSILF